MQAVIRLTFFLTCLLFGNKEISCNECEEERPYQDPCITEYCDDEDAYDEEDSDDAVCVEEKEEKTPIKDFFFKDPNKEERVKAKKTPIRDFFLRNSKNSKRNSDWEKSYPK